MSENPGEGWWMASDGKWYPPELHPSAKDEATVGGGAETPTLVPALVATAPLSPEEQASRAAHPSALKVGPQFPDLFLKAMEGNHLADNMSVVYDGDDERNARQPAVPSTMPRMMTPSMVPSVDGAPAGGAAAVGAFSGASAPKRRWRRH